MDPTMEDLLPIYYDGGNAVFICTSCGLCVSGEGDAMRKHLGGPKHKNTVPEAKKDAILKAVKETPAALKREDVERLKGIADAETALLKLPLLEGFACEGNRGCRFVTQTKEELQRHQRQQHNGGGWIGEKVDMQSIFWKTAPGAFRFFRVCRFPVDWEDPGRVDGVDDVDDDMARVVGVFEDYEKECEKKRAVWTAEVDRRELSMWDSRAGWHRRFTGVDLVKLNALTALPKEGVDPASWRGVLLPAVKKVLEDCHQGARLKSVYIRRLFRSADNNPAVIEYEPLHIVEGATLKKYATTWQHLLCYLLRVVDAAEGQARIEWRGDVRGKVRQVAALLQNGGPPKEVQDRVLEVFVALVKARVGADASLSPVMSFLGAWSFRSDAKVWKTANEVSPMLSQLVYGFRIVGMKDALPQGSDDDGWDVNAEAREFVDDHLRDGVQTVFTELFSLKLYAKKRASEFYVRPTVNWNADASILYHDGIPLKVDDLRRWMGTLIGRARTVLSEKLVLQEPAWLEQHRDPGLMYDQMTWSNSGESFRHFPNNRLEHKWKKLLYRIRDHKPTTGVWSTLVSITGAPGVKRQMDAVINYLDDAEEFLQMLCVICMMTGGLPPRGTELTSWKHANGQSTMRNFYIIGGRLATVSDYNKTDAVMGSPKVVVRFLPRDVAQLYIAYVVDVWPVVQLIDAALMKCDGAERVMSPFLFESVGAVWDTDKVSRLMAKYSRDLGLGLGVAKWREVAIAIDKKLIRSGEEGPSAGAAHALQAGHTEEIERHHYALTVGMLQGVSDETISAFEVISNRWERWWLGSFKVERAEVVKVQTSAMLKLMLQKLDRLGQDVARLEGKVEVKIVGPLTPRATPEQVLSLCRPRTVGEVAPDNVQHTGTPNQAQAERGKRPRTSSAGKGSPRLDKRGRGLSADDEVDDLVRELMGAGAKVRSQGQREAIRAVAVEKVEGAIVRLPPAAGKSLVVQATAATARQQITLVVVPFLALRDDLRQRCAGLARPIVTSVWTTNCQAQSTLVFVTPETAAEKLFATWLKRMDRDKRLEAVFVDECHVLALDLNWRPAMREVTTLLGALSTRVVLMSGTLPDAMVDDILSQVGDERPRSWKRITAPVDPGQLNLEVQVRDLAAHEEYLRQLVLEASPEQRVLIVVMSLVEGEQWSSILGVAWYHRDLDEVSKSRVWQEWKDKGTCLVGTSAIAVGTDIKNIAVVVHYRGAYGLTAYYQHATRGGRNGSTARSICLLAPQDKQAMATRVQPLEQGCGRQAQESMEQYDTRMLYEYLWGTGCRYRLLYRYLNGSDSAAACPLLEDCEPCRQSASRILANLGTSTVRESVGLELEQGDGLSIVEGSVAIQSSNSRGPKGDGSVLTPMTHISNSITDTEIDTVQSLSSDQNQSRPVRVAGLIFPVECIGRTRSAVQATIRELERHNQLELLKRAAGMARRFLRYGCVGCWLEGNNGAMDHVFSKCEVFRIKPYELHEINQGWASGSREGLTGIHWPCGMPLPAHREKLSRQPCTELGDVPRDLVAAASCIAHFEDMFISANMAWPREGWKQLGREGVAQSPVKSWVIVWCGLVVKVIFIGSLSRMKYVR